MSGETAPEATPPVKVDPEVLELRGRPPRVVRFRKGAIIGLAAFGSACLVGVTWMAFDPAEPVGREQPEPDLREAAPPEALAQAPQSYAEVPRLGPPLPGDLGRPILAHRRGQPADGPGGEEARAERERLAEERKAALESALLVPMTASAVPGAIAPDAADEAGSEIGPTIERIAGEGVSADRLVPAPSRWTLSAGSVIAAALMTGLNSDLPGPVTAQVTRNVHDSATGRTLLIPQGSRLVGRYGSEVAFGQERAMLVWERLILPDGSSIRLDELPASDVSGHSGLADDVDAHGGRLLKGIALSTLLGVGTELSLGGEGELVRALREATQNGTARAGDRIVARELDVEPTLIVRPGWPLRVIVHKDLVLEPWED